MTRSMRLLIIVLLAAGLLVTGLPVPKIGPQIPAGHIVAALADDDDNGGGDDDGGSDGGGDDDDGGGGEEDDDDGNEDDEGDEGEGAFDDGAFGGRGDRYSAAREILAVDADPALIRALEAEGFVERERRALSSLQVSISRLTIPPSLNLPSAIARARQVAPGVAYEPNPVYRLAGAAEPEPAEVARTSCSASDCYALDLVGWPNNPDRCGTGLRIGMTDTAVDLDHPALRGRTIRRQRFAPIGLNGTSPDDHGTAVAALLVGNPATGFAGMLPMATLFAADVFHLDRSGQPQATLADLVNGLDWLARQQVSVINISMTGPPNSLLETAVAALDRRGIGIVSAAGNGGPAAAPAFPAAYDGVVSVTAVDQSLRPYRLANQGDYITLASPGVEVWSAAGGGAGRYRTGTSVAAAHVTGAIAELLGAGNDVEAAVRALRNDARDLGSPGRDRVFGWGLLQTSPNCGG